MVIPLKEGSCCLKMRVTTPIMFEKVEVIEDDVIQVDLDTCMLFGMNWLNKNQVKIKCDGYRLSFMKEDEEVGYSKFGSPRWMSW